jgi:hypothetical protein
MGEEKIVCDHVLFNAGRDVNVVLELLQRVNLRRRRPFDKEAHNEAENCFAQIAQIIGECLVDNTDADVSIRRYGDKCLALQLHKSLADGHHAPPVSLERSAIFRRPLG